jgi:hypothetical protein
MVFYNHWSRRKGYGWTVVCVVTRICAFIYMLLWVAGLFEAFKYNIFGYTSRVGLTRECVMEESYKVPVTSVPNYCTLS